MDQSFVITNPSRINHIDPRVKLIHTLIAGILLFVIRSNGGVLINVAFMAAFLIFLGLSGCAARLAIYSASLYAIIRLLTAIDQEVTDLIGVTFYIFFKFSPVLGIYYMMTKSISASELVNALEKVGLPRSVTITLAVTLRFMPTINQEMTAIRASMKMRNISLNLWNFLKSPLMMLEFVMVPMMMRFVKVAEELAASAVVRGIEKPGRRGSMFQIKLRLQDFIYFLFVVLTALFLYGYERGVFR